MRAHIKITDNAGVTYEGTATLERVAQKESKRSGVKATAAQSAPLSRSLSYSLNTRAFMKKYAGGLSGSRKITLLLARLTQGKVGQEIALDQIVSEWNRMTQIMGGRFNRAHATRAKSEGWIDQPKRGGYALSNSWKEIASPE